MGTSDAGEAIKDPDFSNTIMHADGLVIVAPEYNHGYPGLLKHALDTNLKEYIHKPVGLCGVSAGGFGGTRVVESLLPVMRELGLVTIFWDVNISNAGKPLDEALPRRMDKMLNELIWMARVLRYGRDREAMTRSDPVRCAGCGVEMNHHAEKIDDTSGAGRCSRCISVLGAATPSCEKVGTFADGHGYWPEATVQ